MPLFRRPDGVLVKDETPVRHIMPFIMRGRNESAIYHDEVYDITKTRVWLREWNRANADSPTAGLFQLFIWACAQGLWRRPGLNRFVSGKRLYARKGVWISFAAKKEMRDDAPLVTVKLPFPQDEPFGDCVQRIHDSVVEGRTAGGRTVDKELALAKAIPVPLLSFVMGLLRWLDRINLMPAFMIESDPLYTSLFVTNLGSVGLDRTYHHLYETGTAGLFAVMGAPKKLAVVGRDGRETIRDTLEVRWTLDERVNDGFYCASGLKWFKRLIEDPAKYVGNPEALAAMNEDAAASHPALTAVPSGE
jgi:hypothetical protein